MIMMGMMLMVMLMTKMMIIRMLTVLRLICRKKVNRTDRCFRKVRCVIGGVGGGHWVGEWVDGGG